MNNEEGLQHLQSLHLAISKHSPNREESHGSSHLKPAQTALVKS
jgi:hypothetical protein